MLAIAEDGLEDEEAVDATIRDRFDTRRDEEDAAVLLEAGVCFLFLDDDLSKPCSKLELRTRPILLLMVCAADEEPGLAEAAAVAPADDAAAPADEG